MNNNDEENLVRQIINRRYYYEAGINSNVLPEEIETEHYKQYQNILYYLDYFKEHNIGVPKQKIIGHTMGSLYEFLRYNYEKYVKITGVSTPKVSTPKVYTPKVYSPLLIDSKIREIVSRRYKYELNKLASGSDSGHIETLSQLNLLYKDILFYLDLFGRAKITVPQDKIIGHTIESLYNYLQFNYNKFLKINENKKLDFNTTPQNEIYSNQEELYNQSRLNQLSREINIQRQVKQANQEGYVTADQLVGRIKY